MNVIRKISHESENSKGDRSDIVNINQSSSKEKDPLCITDEDVKKTVNVFLSAVENLMNRINGKYKVLRLDTEKKGTINMITKSKKELKGSDIKKIAHAITGRSYKIPGLKECLDEETELKLTQFRSTQEEQREIEKNAIKAKYLSENLDICINNLKYMKYLFYDMARKNIASRYITFSKAFAGLTEDINKEGAHIRENNFKRIDIDHRLKGILGKENHIINMVNNEYFHYLKYLSNEYSEIFDRNPKISFNDIFHNISSLNYVLTIKVHVAGNNSRKETNESIKNKSIYKKIKVKINIRESNKIKFINKSTYLNRSDLDKFMRDNIDSSDTFWILHLAIDKVIKQEKIKIIQERKEEVEGKKKK